MVNETVSKDILDLLGAGITITSADLDIRDLVPAQDEVKAIIRADTAGNQTSDLKITLNGEDVNVTGTFWQATQPVSGTFWQVTQPVSATDLDIRDLAHASDSVENYPHRAATMAYGAITVSDTATEIVSSQTARVGIIILNNSGQTVYIGGNVVTTASGIPLEPDDVYTNQDWAGAIYGIVASGTANVRVEDFY